MRTVAAYTLHYGREWLAWSMRSVRPYVNAMAVFYSPWPSFGHNTTLINPDSEAALKQISDRWQAHWYTAPARPSHEGQHRAWALDTCVHELGAEAVLIVDADEIWQPDHLTTLLALAADYDDKREWRVPMRHFWRSLNWVCHDLAMPARLIRPAIADGLAYAPRPMGLVNHMGYAQSPRLVQYKADIHGHKGEWRPDWFENKFLPWPPSSDVHPTNGENFWQPQPFDKTQLVDLIGDHPYYDLEVIP